MDYIDAIKSMGLSGIYYILLSFIVLFFLAGLFIFIYIRKKYNKKVNIIFTSGNTIQKIEGGYLGGFVKNNAGGYDFEIIKKNNIFKRARVPFNIDETKADSEGNLYFIKIGEGAFQQVEVDFDKEKKQFLIKPIPSDVITSVKNYLLMAQSTFDKTRLSAWAIVFIAFLIQVFAHLIFLFLTRK